jgi:hypothetical protein
MIVARGEAPPLTITEHPATPQEAALARAEAEEFRKNITWFGAHAQETRDAHSGKFICIGGQELFVGDDAVEVVARAKAAHPELTGGFFSMRLSVHRGPKIYANQR